MGFCGEPGCQWAFCPRGVCPRGCLSRGLCVPGAICLSKPEAPASLSYPRSHQSQELSVAGTICPGGVCPRGHLSQGRLSQGPSVPGSICSEGVCPRGCLSRGLSVPGAVSGAVCPRDLLFVLA